MGLLSHVMGLPLALLVLSQIGSTWPNRAVRTCLGRLGLHFMRAAAPSCQTLFGHVLATWGSLPVASGS
eukprot:3769179-Amphidinium_carterae.2